MAVLGLKAQVQSLRRIKLFAGWLILPDFPKVREVSLFKAERLEISLHSLLLEKKRVDYTLM
jgi:uncharacterized protein Usg